MWQRCYVTIAVVVKLFVKRYWLDRDSFMNQTGALLRDNQDNDASKAGIVGWVEACSADTQR